MELDTLEDITKDEHWTEDGKLTEATHKLMFGEFIHKDDIIVELEKLDIPYVNTEYLVRNPKDPQEGVYADIFRFQYGDYLYSFEVLHGNQVMSIWKAERTDVILEFVFDEHEVLFNQN